MIEVKQRSNGLFYFVVKSTNGRVICKSEGFSSESFCLHTVNLLKEISKTWNI